MIIIIFYEKQDLFSEFLLLSQIINCHKANWQNGLRCAPFPKSGIPFSLDNLVSMRRNSELRKAGLLFFLYDTEG